MAVAPVWNDNGPKLEDERVVVDRRIDGSVIVDDEKEGDPLVEVCCAIAKKYRSWIIINPLMLLVSLPAARDRIVTQVCEAVSYSTATHALSAVHMSAQSSGVATAGLVARLIPL